MSSETMIREEKAVATSTDIEAMDAVLLAVSRDCRVEPRLYLDESTVPHGGE